MQSLRYWVSTIEDHKTCSARVILSCIKFRVKVQFLTLKVILERCVCCRFWSVNSLLSGARRVSNSKGHFWVVCCTMYYLDCMFLCILWLTSSGCAFWVSRVQCSISFGFLYTIGCEVNPWIRLVSTLATSVDTSVETRHRPIYQTNAGIS